MKYFFYIVLVFFLLNTLQVLSQEKQGVAVHSDPRLAVVIKKNQAISKRNNEIEANQKKAYPTKKTIKKNTNFDNDRIETYNGRGFRVQIYNGTDRFKAIKIRDEFDKHYPGVHSYLSYVAPYYRIKVGNYRNHNEAKGMLREASSSYFPCMIVPDQITIK